MPEYVVTIPCLIVAESPEEAAREYLAAYGIEPDEWGQTLTVRPAGFHTSAPTDLVTIYPVEPTPPARVSPSDCRCGVCTLRRQVRNTHPSNPKETQS